MQNAPGRDDPPVGSNAAATGDRLGLAQQLEEHRQSALAFAFRLLRDTHEAEEAVQNAFLRLLQRPQGFRGHSSFRTYLFAAVRNSCVDLWRRRVTTNGRPREVNPTTTAFFRSLPEGSRFLGISTQIERRESQEIVRAAIEQLPEQQRACIVLHDLEGMPYRDVAEVLGITPNHVGVLLYQARTRLRELLDKGDFFCDD